MALSSALLKKIQQETEEKKKGATGKSGASAGAGYTAPAVSVGGSLGEKIAQDVALKKFGITDYDSEKGMEKFERYLAEREQQRKAKEKDEEDEKWWEKLGRYLSYAGTAGDSTLPANNTNIVINALREDTSWKEPSDEWSGKDKAIFGYLYETDRKAAEEYAVSVNNAINKAKADVEKQKIKDNTTANFGGIVGGAVESIVSSPLGGADFLMDMAENIARGQITEKDYLSPFEKSQVKSEEVARQLNENHGTLDKSIPVIGGKGFGDVYGLVTSIGQSMATAYTLGGTGTLLSYFGSAAASGIDDAKNRGASDEQAIAFGIMSGFAEAIPEMLSVERLLKIGSSKTFKELMLNIVKQSGAEGIEEGTTSIINNFADNIVMGDFSNFNILVMEYVAKGMSEEEAKKQAWKDIVEGIAFDSLAGAVSGGVSGGIQTGIQSALSAIANDVVRNKPQPQEREQAAAGEVVAENAPTTETKEKAPSAGGKGLRVFLGKGNPAQDIQEYVKGFENATKDTPAQISSMYDPADGLSAEDFARGAEEAYRFGTYSYPIKNMEAEGTFSKSLPSEKRLQTYYIARNNAEEANIAKAKEIQKKVLPGVKGDVVIEGNLEVQNLTRKQNAEIKLAGALAEITGVKTHVFASYVYKGDSFSYKGNGGNTITIRPGMRVWNNGGKIEKAPNGWDDIGNHEIWADINAGSMGQGVVAYTITHEHVHNIKVWSAEHYNKLVKITAEAFEKSGKSFEEAVAKKLEEYRIDHPETTYDIAQEEVVAETMSALLRDKKGLKEFSNQVYKTDRTLWEKIKDWFQEVIAAITNAYKNLAPESEEARMLMEQKDLFEQAQKVFAEAVVTAGQNYKAYSEMAGVQIDANTDSVAPSTMFSERTWSESEYVKARTETARAISKELNVSLDQAYDYIDSINGVARLIADDRVRLDYEPNLDENATVLKPNSEYGVTVDMSTLCAKRLLTTGTFDAIQKKLPNMVFDSEDIVKLRKMMMDRGYEVACGICYVESTRREMGRITQEFIDRYKIAQQTGKPIARVNASGQEVVLKSQGKTFMADKEYTPNLGELNTTDIDYVKRDRPEVYNAYLAFMNARGQAKPKLLETRAEYKGEILKQFKRKDSVEKKNLEGGLRLQSFFDFELPHLIDMMQIVMDMSRVGLKSQAYTKVPKFAEAFGGTGIKINLSLIAKGSGVDADGNLIFDDIEGINHEEAFRIRERFSNNVGTILVGKNDEHIRAAMADPRIDMIIPFHKSSWKESLYEALGLTGYTDYTKYQMEKPIDKSRGKIEQFHSDEYWDYSKTGDENAQIYLQKCREDGRTPVFPQFQNEPGYWKMLIDFKMYDNDGVGAPHEVVKPIFDNEYNAKILDEYKGGHRKLPVAQDVVDDFVKEYDTGTRFQDRDSEYMEAVKKADIGTMQKLVEEAAKEAGYYSPKLYHGTEMFGFTKVKTSGVEKGVAWSPFFATNKEDISATYVPYGKVRDISSTMDEDAIEEARETAIEERKENISDLVDDFRSLIDRYFSEWVFGQSDNSYLESLVENANPEAGHGDGVYDVLSDIVYDAFYDYQDEFEEYEDADDWSENSPEAQKIFSKITDIEGEKSALYRLESGEELGGIYQLYANLDNMYVVDGKGAAWNELHPEGLPKIERGAFKDVPYKTRDVAEWARNNGFDGVIFKNIKDNGEYGRTPAGDVYVFFHPESQVKSADPVTKDDSGNVIPLSERFKESNPDIRYSLREEAPVFYSFMGKVVDGIKTEKIGANGVIPYLKGKGVKDEEIKWSGIEAFLEGKKSVTKQELKEFVEGSMLQIGEAVKEDSTWKPKVKKLSADSVALYSNGELVDTFTKLEEGYWVPSNRIGKEFYVSEKFLADDYKEFHEIGTNWSSYKLDGGRNYRELLFKLPNSNYSNTAMQGHWGYDAKGILAHARVQDFKVGGKKMLFIEEIQSDWHNEGHEKGYADKSKLLNVNNTELRLKDDWYYLYHNGKDLHHAISGDYLKRRFPNGISEEEIHEGLVDEFNDIQVRDKISDAPFHNNYHEFVLKRLIREAAEKGYDSIGWTTADIQSDRWSDEFAEGYRIEYDQDIPKFLNKYGKKWGAQVGKATLRHGFKGTEVWSIPITDAMKESVLSEGQPLYQERLSVEDRNRVEILENKVKRLEGELEKMEANAVLAGQMSQGKAMAKEMRLKAKAFEEAIVRKKEQIAEVRARRDELLEKAKAEKADAVARVRQEARDRLEKRISDVKAQKNAQIDALRKRHEERQDEIREKYRDSIKKATEGRHRTLMRAKIKRVVNELNDLLLHGGKERHVPERMKAAVAKALDVFNIFDPTYYENRIRNLEQKIAEEQNPAERAKLKIEHAKILEQREKAELEFTVLKASYDELGKDGDSAFDPVVAEKIDAVAVELEHTKFKDMSMAQLQDVYDLFAMLKSVISKSNKLFAQQKAESVAEIGEKAIAEVRKVGGKHPLLLKATKGIRAFSWNNLKPIYAFERIGSAALTDMFKSIRRGEDTWAKDVSEARDFYKKAKEKHHAEKWDKNKTFAFETSEGIPFELTVQQMMSIYAYSKRKDADKHLSIGGFVFDPKTEIKKGLLKYEVNNATAHNISPETILEIAGKLTDEQRAFVDEMQTYLSEVMGEKGNEVSMAMYDVKLFNEKNYFPLKSANQYLFEQNNPAGEIKLKNSGFTKSRVPGANNPVVLSDFIDVWANHVNDMSMYHSFVLPIEDFNRVYNYKTSLFPNQKSVKGVVQNAYGKEANDYISGLITDLNGGARVDRTAGFMNKLIGGFKKASVFASASVVIQQPSSIVRAHAIIGDKYFYGLPKVENHKKLWEEIKKYAPVAIIKEMGYFDTNMGRSTVDYIKDEKTLGSRADDFFSFAPAYADEVTWGVIWNAVKRESKAKNPNLNSKSEEFLKIVGERFTEVVTKTQVYDSVLSRSANMRSKDTGMKMATAFMAEPTTSINMLEDAVRQWKRGNKKQATNQIAAVYGSILLNAALVSLVYAARDDDEDENYLEKYIGSFTTEIIDGMNPLTYVPFIKDIWSIAQGFDVERADMSLATKLIEAFEKASTTILKDTSDMDEEERAEHNKEINEAVLGIVDYIAALFGQPVKNIRRDLGAAKNLVETIMRGQKSSMGSIFDQIIDSAKNAVPGWGWVPDETKGDKLYDAIRRGDETYAERLEGGFKSESSRNSALRGALRDNDPRIREAALARINGDPATYMKIAREIIADGFSQDDVVKAINSEINAINKGESESPSVSKAAGLFNADDYIAAIRKGDQAAAQVVRNDIISTAMANGKDLEDAEKSFMTSFKSAVWEAYENRELSQRQVSYMLTNYAEMEEEVQLKFQVYEWKASVPGADDITASAIADYNEFAEPAGISKADYYKAWRIYNDTDADIDPKTGEGVAYSKVKKVMPQIDALPLTPAQKTALAKCWWAESTVRKYKTW